MERKVLVNGEEMALKGCLIRRMGDLNPTQTFAAHTSFEENNKVNVGNLTILTGILENGTEDKILKFFKKLVNITKHKS